MPFYRIADFTVEFQNRYPRLERQCAAYRLPDGTGNATPDFRISVSEEEIDASEKESPGFSRGYHESICMYRKLCTCILHRDAMLIHAAVVACDGYAYAFSAKSKTGKSTHIALWRRCFGDRVSVINGDKPILRLHADGQIFAYGTPWCGKEGWNTNTSAPLAALCFLEQSPENRIRPLSSSEALDRILHQLLRPRNAAEMDLTLRFTDILLRKVPIFLLGCNMKPEAAELSFRTLTAVKGVPPHENP